MPSGKEATVSESLCDQARAFRGALARFDASLHSGEACASIAKELAAVEKACAAARARAAARAADCAAHRRAGFADPADWMAGLTGSSVGEARRQLEATASVRDCPDTESALRNGEISLGQAREIANAEAQRPGSEAELLPLA